ncbi:MAG: acyl carrier protein [Bacillota bacterium]|jgi:acyl carrier protein
MNDIANEIIGIFKETIQDDDIVIDLDATFKELEIDSLDLLEVVTAIERRYKISISDDALGEIKTAGDAIAYVEKLVNQG